MIDKGATDLLSSRAPWPADNPPKLPAAHDWRTSDEEEPLALAIERLLTARGPAA